MCDRDCDVIVSQNYSTAKEVRKQVENSEQIKASIYNHVKKLLIPWVTLHMIKLPIFLPTKFLYMCSL